MRKISKKQLVIGGVAALAIAVGGGAAYAYWTSGGTGNGSETTGTSSNFTVSVENLTDANLSPGGPTDTVHYTVTNNDSGVEHMTSATPSVLDTSDPGCTAADFDVTNPVFTAGDLAGLATSSTFSFDVQMKDTGVPQNACKGVTVNLQVVVA